MNVNSYLNRLNISEVKHPSLGFLTELQKHHLLAIPFEDLDIPNRARIELNLRKLYNKIIPTKRGGFCYELNGLFYWLLTKLGYKVDMLSARVYNQRTNELGPEFDHLVLLVHLKKGLLEKDFLVDVGFGDSFRIPIEMPRGRVEDVSGKYRIINKKNNLHELQRKIEELWVPQYCFTTIPHKLVEFKNMCAFQQDNPESHFRNRMVCTIATENGRVTLSNNSLTITENNSKTKLEFDGEIEFYYLLKKHFGIELQPLVKEKDQ